MKSPRAVVAEPAPRKKYRTTVVFPRAVGYNLELFAFQNNRRKNDVIEEAVIKFLEENGMKPRLMPKVRITFGYE